MNRPSGRMRMTPRPKASLSVRFNMRYVLVAGASTVLLLLGAVVYFQFSSIDKTFAGSGITLVQQNSIDASNQIPGPLSFTSDNTAGNLIVVAVYAAGSNDIPAIIDLKGNNYLLAKSQEVTGNTYGYVFYAKNITGGANAVTVKVPTGTELKYFIYEFSGITVLNPFHSAKSIMGSNANPQSGEIVVSSGTELIFGFSFTPKGNAFTINSVPGNISNLQTEFKIVGPGKHSTNSKLNSPGPWGSIVVAFFADGSKKAANEIIFFKPEVNDGQVMLSWEAASSINSDHITVERSADGQLFEEVVVNQSMETVTGEYNFKVIDPDPIAGIAYYRLKYTAHSGQVVYSNAERITNEDIVPGNGVIHLTAIEPAIFTEGFTINFTSKFESTVELIIVNNSGKTVYANKMEAKKGHNIFEFKEGQKLFRNIYFVKLICNGQQVTKKVLKK